MRVFAGCRKNRDAAGHRTSRTGQICLGLCLTSVLAVVGLSAMAWTATDSTAALAAAGAPSPFQQVIDFFAGKADAPAVAPRQALKPNPPKPSNPQPLVTESEKPEDHKKIADESAYPATDAPEKLTFEQLDAIAKLPPKANKSGKQVHPAMVPLFRSMVLHYTGGNYNNAAIRFRLHTPEPYKQGKKYPLVVWLHGAGECGDDNVNQLSHLHHIIPYLVGPKKRDFFLLVPQCPHTHTAWEAPEICETKVRPDGSVECHVTDDAVALGDAPIAFTLEMIDAVMKEFPVDANRVTVSGLSTGGKGTWRILERRPNLFAAAAPIVSWEAMHDKSLRENPILTKIPIWAIYSSDDHGIDFARKEFQRMRDAGCHVFKTEFGVCGHRAWTPAMLQGDVFGWLTSRAKDGKRFYAAEASPTDPQKIGIFADVTEGDLKRQPTRAKPSTKPVDQPTPQPVAPATPAPTPTQANPTLTVPPQASPFTAIPPSTIHMPYAPPGSATPPTYAPGPVAPGNAVPTTSIVDQSRLELIRRYVAAGDMKKALATADKVRNRQQLVNVLLQVDATTISERVSYATSHMQVAINEMPRLMQDAGKYADRELLLDYVDRELDRMEQRGESPIPTPRWNDIGGRQPRRSPVEAPLKPTPAGKRSPKDECGKEWAMSSTTQYGLFPNGWEQEGNRVPGYIVNETGKQLCDRLAKAFADNDLGAMKEFCDTFIRLDDIPLSSPWFDVSGGRLQGRIKYTLNAKAQPVVELLREIAQVKAESKQELVEIAKKSLERIDAIVNPKAK